MVTVTSLAGVLVFSPIATAVTHSSFESIPAPDPVDPGESELVVPEIPEYVPHEVRTPAVVSTQVTGQVGAVAAVEGLPVTVRVLSTTPSDTSEPADAEQAATTTESAPDAGEAPAVTDTTVAGEDVPTTSITAPTSTTPGDGSSGSEQVGLLVESLDADTVSMLGGEVLAFGVTPSEPTGSLKVEVAIDYSGFRFALGADWAARLQLVQWSCDPALARVTTLQCGNPIPVEGVVNDLKAGVLTATVELGFTRGVGAGESRPGVLTGNGSTLGLASAAGAFTATSLSNSGSWQVGGNNGSFSYSYPIAVPPAFNGLGPSVSLSYDSSGADGITSSVNSQASDVGLGWNLNAGQGFIERRYLHCQDSRIGGGSSDTCWYAQNATISLNGRASELVPVNGTTGSPSTFTQWRLKDDSDWLVERVNSPSGDWWTSEYWKVTTPEGMVYWFGREDDSQNSRLVRPLRGISSSSDPCWYRADKLCTDMPYRWMLDRVDDPYGNTMIYKYWKEKNQAKTLGSGYLEVEYHMAALLTEILYGKTPATTAEGDSPATAAIGWRGRVLFSYARRCVEALSTSIDADCPAVTNANGTSYPDVPTDLYCPYPGTYCPKEPSFFQIRRLTMITTYTRSTGTDHTSGWSPVRQWRTYGAFPDPGDGGNEKLWLYYIAPVAPDNTVTPPTYATVLTHGTIFGGTPKANRWDTGGGVPLMNQYRVNNIFDDLGQQIIVNYTSDNCGSSPYNWSTNTTNCFPMHASFDGGHSGWGVYRRWVVDSVVVRDLVAGNRGSGGTSGTGVAPDITTDYTYEGAAKHHDGNDWWVDNPSLDDVSWGQWRGYRTVTTTVGVGSTKTVTKQVFYQGMHGDKASSGTKTVTMTRGFTVTSEGYAGTIYDDDWLAGTVFESYQMDGTSGNFLSASRSQSRWTLLSTDSTITRSGFPDKETRKWAITLQHTKIRDVGATFKETRTDTVVDTYGRVVRVHNSGFIDVTDDETCQRTIYIGGSTPPTTATPGWLHLVAQSVSYAGQGTLPDQSSYAPDAGACAGRPVGESKFFYGGNDPVDPLNLVQAANASTQTLSATLKPVVTASLTRTKNWDGATDWLDRWVITTSTVDAAGRITETFDARETRTALFTFNTDYGYPNKATYPLGVGFTQTVLRPEDGQPASTTDQNGNVTNYCYDSLSRLTKAYQPAVAGATPNCASTTEPTVRFTYNLGTFSYDGFGVRIAKTPAIVETSVLQSTTPSTVRVSSWALIDGFGRTRETQRWSPTSGKILVTASLFNDRGLNAIGVEEFVVSGTPGNYASNSPAVDGFETFPNLPTSITLRTNVSYFDTAGRVVGQERKNGTTVLVYSNTEYLGSKTITKPQIGSYQATVVDGMGRTARVETYNGTSPPTAAGLANAGGVNLYDYDYDPIANAVSGHETAGWLTTTVTDDAGNVTEVVTDLAGRTATSDDPNAGQSEFTYDANGNITKTEDTVGNVVNTEYDVLNRPTGRWSGGATSFAAADAADRLASWTYDTVSGGKGMAATETSWQNSLQYTTSITGYNTRYQVTSSKINIPGVFTTDPLAGDWKFTTSYNEAGQPVSIAKPLEPIDPTVGGDPATDVTTTNYNGFGQPDQLWEGATATPTNRYVKSTTFDDWGRVTGRTMSRATATSVPALRRAYEYNTATGALDEIKARWTVSGTPGVWFQHDKYTRDAIGRVTQIEDAGVEPGSTASAVKECFLYDNWNRLIRAHSATLAAGCATNTTNATTAGSSRDPYDTVWTFDDINRMRTSQDMYAVGTPTTTYVPDSVHPHAVDELTDATDATIINYEYDLNGAMETRGTEGLTYDAQQRLTKYSTTEEYVYTTTNQRLIRQAGGTRTLYLPGMEVSVTGTTRTINCYLTIGTTQIGTKTKVGGGAPSYMWACGNMQNSNVCQVTADSNTIPQRKRYTPYGASRQTVPVTFPNTDRGFLNQPQDTNGLVYLNNRYHDPTLGHFISVDPLVGQTGMPYLYANGSPATLSDPSGLFGILECGPDGAMCSWDAIGAASGIANLEEIAGIEAPEAKFEGPYLPPVNSEDNGPTGDRALGPWTNESTIACVQHTAPTMNDAGCRASSIEFGALEAHEDWMRFVLDKQYQICALIPATCITARKAKDHTDEQIAALTNSLLTEDDVNAIQHAYWFAWQVNYNGPFVQSRDDYMTLGRAHENTNRNSWIDAERDMLNNEIGMLAGEGLSGSATDIEVMDLTMKLFNMGLLYCVSGSPSQAPYQAQIVRCS